MVEHLDQDQKLERRTLRKANELFLRLLHEQALEQRHQQHRVEYWPEDDFAKSIDEAYRVIRERVANGGKGWTPP
jgi:hypothetical protein